ncbi:MAG: imidazole glycerol phosphate synthase subunit HisH [Deltaproteobacteria bacterium]|nr:imidazole glycerol phosphate synthase subunit HisH [Deltaproteobacteria bacterium]MDQ3300713.1 imidazole glycerol phosphate synthase subunit HisH [Myxococcota bacterium]
MIAVVDVCSGNLRSVERALAKVGGDVQVTRDPDVVRRASKIVVPGQGAFGVFMRGLVERGLGEALREAITSGRPYLGICLGLQVLFDDSEEGGACAGLGVIRGRVVRLRPTDPRLKVPHMGWNRVQPRAGAGRGAGRGDRLLAGIPDPAYVYFVHSFHAVPEDRSLVALEAEHGTAITAAIRHDNLFACQFHPEKSQAIGLQILRNFVEAA